METHGIRIVERKPPAELSLQEMSAHAQRQVQRYANAGKLKNIEKQIAESKKPLAEQDGTLDAWCENMTFQLSEPESTLEPRIIVHKDALKNHVLEHAGLTVSNLPSEKDLRKALMEMARTSNAPHSR
ncbi:MAG: hypothetical protein WCX64_03495 [Candidatus Micrarchaeia archaeon]